MKNPSQKLNIFKPVNHIQFIAIVKKPIRFVSLSLPIMQQGDRTQTRLFAFAIVGIFISCLLIYYRASSNDCTVGQISMYGSQLFGNDFILIPDYSSQQQRRAYIKTAGKIIGYFYTNYLPFFDFRDMKGNPLWTINYDYNTEKYSIIMCGDTVQYTITRSDSFQYNKTFNMLKISSRYMIHPGRRLSGYLPSIYSSSYDPFQNTAVTFARGPNYNIASISQGVNGTWIATNLMPDQIQSVFLGFVGTLVAFRNHNQWV
jgi:hypothetical protein